MFCFVLESQKFVEAGIEGSLPEHRENGLLRIDCERSKVRFHVGTHIAQVRHVGAAGQAVSGSRTGQPGKSARPLGISALHHFTKVASLQAYYSIAGRDLERDIIPMLEHARLGLLVWSPLAGGLLGGNVTRDQQSREGTRRSALAFPPVDMDRAFNVIDALKELAEEKGASVARLSIAWLLRQRRVTSVSIGAKRVEQLDDNLGAVDVTFTDEELVLLDRVSAIPAGYPGWMFGIWSQLRATQLAGSRAS